MFGKILNYCLVFFVVASCVFCYFAWENMKAVKKGELQLQKNFTYTFISKDDIKVYEAKWRKGGYLEINRN